jgi:hypothetical protein
MADGRAPNTPSPHVREKRRRRRAEILHAALRAFRENGYHTRNRFSTSATANRWARSRG